MGVCDLRDFEGLGLWGAVSAASLWVWGLCGGAVAQGRGRLGPSPRGSRVGGCAEPRVHKVFWENDDHRHFSGEITVKLRVIGIEGIRPTLWFETVPSMARKTTKSIMMGGTMDRRPRSQRRLHRTSLL